LADSVGFVRLSCGEQLINYKFFDSLQLWFGGINYKSIFVEFVFFYELKGLLDLLRITLSQLPGCNGVFFEIEAYFFLEVDLVVDLFELVMVGHVLFGILD